MSRMESQHGFDGGEISRRLRSRVDASLYDKALALGRNLLISIEGDALNRPGWMMVKSAKFAGSKAVLWPFIFGGGQNYILEVGVGYIRFYQLGAVVESSPGVPYEVATTYVEADLPRLKITQSGDTVIIEGPSLATKQLVRQAHTNWVLSAFSPAPSVTAPVGLAFSSVATDADAQHVGKGWDIVITAITGGDTPEESLPSAAITIATTKALYPDRPAFYQWTAHTNPNVVRYAVYRAVKDSGKYGFIGESAGTTFRDDGQVPLYAEPPPSGRNPFQGAASNNPQCSTYHAQRLFFANSINAPNTVWASRLASFKSFDAALPPKEDDAMTITLGTRRFDEIRSMVSLVDLYLFGSGAEWVMTGVNGAPPIPGASPCLPVSYWGSSWVDPIIAGDTLLFVTDQDSHVRELILNGEGRNVGRDLSLIDLDLIAGQSIVSATFCRTPFSTAFYVRDDGLLLALSYSREQQRAAWSWWDTDGVVEWIASVPEDGEDALYALVRRTVNGADFRFVERLATRDVIDDRTGVFLDGSSFFDGANLGATTVKATGASYAAGAAVTLLASTAIFANTDVGDAIAFGPGEAGADVVATITAYTDTTHVTAHLVADLPAELQNVATVDWGWCRKTFAGLNHLTGETVRVLADGQAIEDLAVVAGSLTLPAPACRVVIGRDYTPEIGLLALSRARARRKNVAKVHFEVVDTALDGLMVGETVDTLRPWKPPPEVMPDAESRLFDGLITMAVESDWNVYGEAVLRQSKPLPLTLTAAHREVADGEG